MTSNAIVIFCLGLQFVVINWCKLAKFWQTGSVAEYQEQFEQLVMRASTLTQHPQFIKQLTKAEMEDRRVKSLCYNCDEPFVRGRQCKRLFWIEVIETSDENDSSDDIDNSTQP